MNGAVFWALVALGLLVVVTRRRSIAVALVTVQALVLVGIALDKATTVNDVVAAGALVARALGLAALFLWLAMRTRSPRPIRAGARPFVRAALAVAFALTLTWLVPTIGLSSRDAERAVLALVAFGLVSVAMRRPTLFQVLGIVLAENGLALAALELPGALVASDRARRRARPDADRARRRAVPLPDLRRVRHRRHRRAAEPA